MPTTSWSLLHQSQSNSCICNFFLLGSVNSYFLLLGRKYAVSYWSTTHQIWWYHAPRPPALPQNTCEPSCRTICRCLPMVLTSLDNRVIWKNFNQLGEYYIILHRSKSGQCGSHHNSSNTMYASAFHLSMDPPAPTTCGQVVSCSTSTHRTQRTLHSNHMHRLQTKELPSALVAPPVIIRDYSIWTQGYFPATAKSFPYRLHFLIGLLLRKPSSACWRAILVCQWFKNHQLHSPKIATKQWCSNDQKH